MGHRVMVAVLVAALAGGVPAAWGQSADERFPSEDPDVRVGTPNDPKFDCNEPDDEDDVDRCPSVFDEQWQILGFGPSSTSLTAVYKDLERLGQPQVSGVSADRAWKTTTGSPQVVIAVTDTGVRWDREDLRTKIFLNTGELPMPAGSDTYDADGDGAITVDDWAADPRVSDTNETGVVDGQDLIRAFSDGVDDDDNGYVDDISGWDWLNDDNDPDDTSSVSSARNHGSGRMEEAAERTNEGVSGAGVCPDCRVLPLKVWDSFVVPGDNWAQATVYTADIGAQVQVAANGVLGNSETMQAANRYAYDNGVALMHVSSDLNTANHNYPTNYPESMFINGCVSDVDGLGAGGNEFFSGLGDYGLPSDTPVSTWFRQANLTQYGAHAHVCFMGSTGSQATGQAGGGAGLVIARGLEVADEIGGPLSANEVKQLLTMTAEDVLPENTVGLGMPDPAAEGWDEYFGYGRADLGAAVERVEAGRIPPEVLIEDPAWWHLLDPIALPTVPVVAHVAAPRSTGWTAEVAWGPGVQPSEDEFTVIGTPSGSDALDGTLADLDMADVAAALPGAAEGTPPADPNAYVFTVRVRVTDADGNVGEDRRAYFAFHDPDQPEGWPRFVDAGGESSPIAWDLDGDGTLEVIEADSSGRVTATSYDGTPSPAFNDGEAWTFPPAFNHHPGSPGFRSGAVPPPSQQGRTPAVADLDGDLAPEVVVASGDGRIWALDADGETVPGWPVSVDPALSAEAIQTPDLHVKRGFIASPSIADLDADGDLEVVAAALDGHVYVWHHDGTLADGFPVLMLAEGASGGELIATPTIADLDGDGDLEVVVMSNEVHDAIQPDVPASLEDVQSSVAGLVVNLLSNAIGGSTRIHAVDHAGGTVDGWPVAINSVLPDVLPLVGPSHVSVAVDVDGDGDDEVIASATAGDTTLFDGDGTTLSVMPATGVVGSAGDPTQILNLFEYLAVGDLGGDGTIDATKIGLTASGAVNLLIAGQNLPFNHVVQAWDIGTATAVPGFPTVHDDFGLLSRPAVADVDGDGGAEVVAGSGLYLIRAYGALGQEVEGFPKLTGGWTYAVPLIADLDGDGDVELVGSTREGWRHLWDLDSPTGQASVGEWPVDNGDERSSNRYGQDVRPPVRPQDLTVTSDGAVRFTAPGDDWWSGPATAYEVYTSPSLMVDGGDVLAAEVVAGAPAPAAPRTDEAFDVTLPSDVRSVAVVAVDDVGNRSMPAIVDLDPDAGPAPEPTPDPVDEPAGPTLPATGAGGMAALVGGLAVLLAARRRVSVRR